MIGENLIEILMNRWILPVGVVALGRVGACSMHSTCLCEEQKESMQLFSTLLSCLEFPVNAIIC